MWGGDLATLLLSGMGHTRRAEKRGRKEEEWNIGEREGDNSEGRRERKKEKKKERKESTQKKGEKGGAGLHLSPDLLRESWVEWGYNPSQRSSPSRHISWDIS